MKKGDMEMSSIKLQFANIYCNNHMLSKQIMWTFISRLDAQRREKGDKQTKRYKEPHYGVVSITGEDRIKHSRSKDHSAKNWQKKTQILNQKKTPIEPYIRSYYIKCISCSL